jgi:aspartyl aminopeptidase
MTFSKTHSSAVRHARDMLAFINASPSPWHAVSTMVECLQEDSFTELLETDTWALQAHARHFVIRGGSLIAFICGGESPAESGYRIAGAHTDSPGLRLKPLAAHVSEGMLRLGVEVYGGPILATFTDRDLGLAGRVQKRSEKGIETQLINISRPVVRLPNLAIHMNREVNEQGLKLNRQTELNVLFSGQDPLSADAFKSFIASELNCAPEDMLAMDVLVRDTQEGAIWGAREEYVSSGQLDNLASCHSIIQALLKVDEPRHTVVGAFFDHEEVGSESSVGASGSFVSDILARIGEGLFVHGTDALRARARSTFMSLDMAHAFNPNFPAASEPNHRLRINGGPAIKFNASQRYATDSESAARVMRWCEAAEVPFQQYVHRSDLACGSTIGPMVSARLGMPTVDVGAPMWAMHSLRESAGVLDSWWLTKVLDQVFEGR